MSGSGWQALMLVSAAVALFAVAGLASTWLMKRTRSVSQGINTKREQTDLRQLVDDDLVVLQRLADGDTIKFSQDGDAAWFTKGDRAFVGDAVIRLREKGFTERRCDDDENYRGMSEYDAISDVGRAALATPLAAGGK